MSCYSGPEISSSGLVLSLDPANIKSYNQSENLLKYSEQFENVVWIRTNTSVSTNIAVDPNEYLTADKLIGNNGVTGRKSICQPYTSFIAGTTYTFSIYLKQAGFTNAMIWIDTVDSSPNAYMGAVSLINLAAGTVAGSQTTIVNASNGWYRCYITFTATVSGTYNLQISLGEANGSGTAAGDGVSGIYLWGAQLEIGASLTAYTSTIGSIITRSTAVSDISNNTNTGTLVNSPVYSPAGYFSYDYTKSQQLTFANNPNLQFLGNSPYTLEAWIYPTRNPGASNYTGIFDRESNPGSGRDGYNLYFLGGTAGATTQITAERFSAGTASATWITLYESVSVNAWHHIVATYDGSLLRIYRNGSYVSTSSASTGAITNTVKTLTIGVRGGNRFDGRIGVTNIYNRALSASEIKQNFNAYRSKYGI